MEVVPTGFANVTPAIVLSVTALEMKLSRTRTNDPLTAGRELTVGIPPLKSWENVRTVPLDERWMIEEDYLPGPAPFKITLTRAAQYEHQPMYVLRLNGLAGSGATAMYSVAQGILDGFPPLLDIPMSDGGILRVRTEMAPYRTQLIPSEDAGRAEIVITIPLWKRTTGGS
jgi:hypothetical protein